MLGSKMSGGLGSKMGKLSGNIPIVRKSKEELLAESNAENKITHKGTVDGELLYQNIKSANPELWIHRKKRKIRKEK